MSTVVLSVRIRKELKEEAERLGINIRNVVERALREEIYRVKKMHFKKLLEEALRNMNISVNEWVEAVKEERREH
jgi:post-segregation antitoxin (ccd killing protein)